MAENTNTTDQGDNSPQDEIKPVINMKQIGRSGTLVSGQVIDNEYLPELQGAAGQQKYERMLTTDSQIVKIYHGVSNPIRSAKWDIEAASTEAQDVKIAALIKQIIFNDLPDGWVGKLDEILTFPWKGYAPFEVVHQNRTHKKFGQYTGLKNLAFREQETITKWNFVDGILKEIYQEQAGDIPVNTWIPVEHLLIFFNQRRGDNLGFPFCRMLYGNYKRKLLYKQLQAIGIERGAIPVPHLQYPTTLVIDSEQYLAAKSQLDAFTQAETAYFMYPEGFKLEFNQTNSYDPSKTQSAIKAENEEIVGALLAMFLEMGIGGNSGNQAGTEVSAGFFRDGIVYIANKISETINLKLIPNLVRLNFGEVETYPRMTHAGITEEAGKELMEIVTGYTKAGVIQIDEPLEDYVRKQHSFPAKAEGDMIDNGTAKEEIKPKEDKNAEDSKQKTPSQKLLDTNFNLKFEPIELAAKGEVVPEMIAASAEKIKEVIKNAVRFSGEKFIADTIRYYKQLPEAKKQNATNKVSVGGQAKFKDALKAPLSEAASVAINQARKEIPAKKDVKLNSKQSDFDRVKTIVGELGEIKLNEYSKLPTHVQVLIAKQAELITTQTLEEVVSKLSFSYSSIETKSADVNVIESNMEETLNDFLDSGAMAIKAENVSAMIVNESRNTFFFEPEVMESIHSFTFMNAGPKSKICQELTGITFNVNDAESLRYHPPLHHGCKSYLRANLTSSAGVEKLQIKTLSPSADAIKSITL